MRVKVNLPVELDALLYLIEYSLFYNELYDRTQNNMVAVDGYIPKHKLMCPTVIFLQYFSPIEEILLVMYYALYLKPHLSLLS
jgi:hypothetical protein